MANKILAILEQREGKLKKLSLKLQVYCIKISYRIKS